MLQRDPINLPEHIYPFHPWQLVETQFYPRFLGQQETLFALSNGYLGMRGCYEEGRPIHQSGTFINGFHESWPIVYPEDAFGFAKTGQTLLTVPDSSIIKLFVDDEPFFLPTVRLLSYERSLNMKAGTLDRHILWETPAGKQISIKSKRLVSFEHRHLAAISYEVTAVNCQALIEIESQVHYDPAHQGSHTATASDDPRQSRGFRDRVLLPRHHTLQNQRAILAYETRNSGMTLACGIDHTLSSDVPVSITERCTKDSGKVVFAIKAEANQPIRLTKYITYHTSRHSPAHELCDRVERTLTRGMEAGFESLETSQKQYLDVFWARSDVQVERAPDTPSRADALQQAIRFSLFHVLQAASRTDGIGLPAKGLTGEGYEGHYFWDTEIYVLPFLIHTNPSIAKNLLQFRYSLLDHARQRAREVNQTGALFPWRTINGEEASAYYAAGTAQYHINGDIIFGLKKYAEITGDEDFLYGEGAEMLVETARLWSNLGFFSARAKGQFCIHSVTGPDEYNTVVNNNLYTNVMARENLRYAASTLQTLEAQHPERFASLVHKTDLQRPEITDWQRAADQMYIPFDEALDIHLQHDGFLDEKVWDFENTPADKYPLLLHFHPLYIYSHQVLKQADLVLAMFLLGNEFSLDQKQRNFEYYDPLTTGDSSLSVCIQSILAAEIGDLEKATTYAIYSIIMDIGDLSGNVRDGCHIASMGGSWMAMVHGFGGMRDYGGKLTFDPKLPPMLKRLKFPLTIQGQQLQVEIEREMVTYALQDGPDLAITHQGKEILLSAGTPVLINTQAG